MLKTAIATAGPEVTVTPAPNGRALLTLEGRGWTLIDAMLTTDEVAALMSALVGYAIANVSDGSEYKVCA